MAPSWQELPRARLGPILLFSLTAGAIFSFLATRWGYWPAASPPGSWVLQPNLFGHGHYAAYDAVLDVPLGPVHHRVHLGGRACRRVGQWPVEPLAAHGAVWR